MLDLHSIKTSIIQDNLTDAQVKAINSLISEFQHLEKEAYAMQRALERLDRYR